MADDRYAKFDYSRLISWDDRLRREWPLLEEILGTAPSRTVLDLGSGTGEHARLLASKGFDVTGVDSSPAMVERSTAARVEGTRFVLGDARALPDLLHQRYGAALCLGNALPHFTGEDDIARLASGLGKVLLPGAPVVIQLLNYGRFEAKGEQALPLSFFPDPENAGSKIIFLRVMDPLPDRRVIFMPTTLRVSPSQEAPVEVVASQRVEIRGWRHDEIAAAFERVGFVDAEVWGSYQKSPFEPAESRDVIFVARRGSD